MVFASYFLLSSKIRVQGTEAKEKRRKKRRKKRKEKKMNDSFPGFMTRIKEKKYISKKQPYREAFLCLNSLFITSKF